MLPISSSSQYRLIIGVLFALAASLATALTSNQRELAALLGLSVITLTLLVDWRLAEEGRQRIVSVVRAFPDEELGRLEEALESIRKSCPPLFRDRMKDLSLAFTANAVEISRGHFRISAGAEVWRMIALSLDSAQRNVFATSLVRSEDFWTLSDAVPYKEANRSAANRLSLIRVFITENREAMQDSLVALMKEQAGNRVDVRVAFAQEIDPGLAIDFGIFDDSFATTLELPVAASGPVLGYSWWSSETLEYKRLDEIRRRLLLVAIRLDDALKGRF